MPVPPSIHVYMCACSVCMYGRVCVCACACVGTCMCIYVCVEFCVSVRLCVYVEDHLLSLFFILFSEAGPSVKLSSNYRAKGFAFQAGGARRLPYPPYSIPPACEAGALAAQPDPFVFQYWVLFVAVAHIGLELEPLFYRRTRTTRPLAAACLGVGFSGKKWADYRLSLRVSPGLPRLPHPLELLLGRSN